MLERMTEFCSYFPSVEIHGRFVKDLQRLRLGLEPGRYTGMALFVSFFLAIFCFVVFVFWQGALLAIPLALLSFALVFGFFLLLPGMELKKRTAEIETEMPFFLRTVGLFIELGVPFQRALELASEEDGALPKEMEKSLGEVREGMGLQKALSSFAASYDSLVVKRAVSQLLSAYEVGSSGGELKRIADELLSVQRHGLKEYAAKSAMFGLMFIMSSAILPTFFLIYAVLGRVAMGAAVSDAQIAIALLVVFPMVSVLIAMLSRAMMPRSAFSEASGFDARLLLPGVVFIGGFLLVPNLQLPVLAVGMLAGAYFFYASHSEEKRMEDIERQLPDALFSVSGMPRATRPERIFEIIEKGGHGALSDEAAKSRSQLAMNLKVDAVLDDLWKRNPSAMMRRVCLMMRQMMRTNSLDRLSALGEDIIATFQIKRERSQMLALQKYTLVFGALLIPLILRMTLYLLQSMNGLFQDDAMAGTLSFAASIVPPYLVIYAIICSAVIADAEGKKSSAALYFLGLTAMSLAAFFINL